MGMPISAWFTGDDGPCAPSNEERTTLAAREHEDAIWRHNREARPWATMRRAARLARELRAARADLEAMHRANARADATIARLEEELRCSRQVNEQAEKVRDENDRLRRDVAHMQEKLMRAQATAIAEGRAAK